MRRRWGAALAVLLVLALGACSDDGDDDATDETSTTEADAGDEAAADEPVDDGDDGDDGAPCDAVNDLTDPDASSAALNTAVDAYKATGQAPDATAGVTYQQTTCEGEELRLTVVGDGIDPQLLVFAWDGTEATFQEAQDAATACAGDLDDLEAQILGC